MRKLLIAAALSLALAGTGAQAQPAPTSLPRGVRETAPTQVKTVKLMTFRLGARNSPVLVHIWKVARRSRSSLGSTTNISDSRQYGMLPFCADVYVPSAKPNEWRWVSAINWHSNQEPRRVEARWLHPRQKRGPVLLIDTTEAEANGLRTIVAAFPNGVQQNSSLQEYQGYSGSSGSTYYSFDRVDKRGLMVVTLNNSSGGGPTQGSDDYWDEDSSQFRPASSAAP